MTLAATLEARFRRELAAARVALAPMLEEPFYQANSLAALNDTSKRGGVWGPLPALFVKPDGSWWGAGVEGHVERAASCAEALELLEKHAPDVAEYEARAMTLAGELLVSDAEERAAWLECTVEPWPWTRAGGLGSVPDILPMLVGNMADLVSVVNGTDRLLRVPDSEHLALLEAYAETTDVADVTAWIAEALERRWPGEGAKYRAKCDGSELVATYSEIGPDGAFVGPPVVQPRRIAWPNGGGFPEHLVLGTANGGAGDLVTGEQLEMLYRTLPRAVLHARALWRDVGRLARGDLRRLLEHTAPVALHEAKEENTREARAELASAVLRHAQALHERLELDGTPPATEAEANARVGALSKGFADYVTPMGDSGKKLAASVREASAARANASADERWKLWRSEPGREPRWLVELAVVVWGHEAKRDLAKRARTPVGAALPVARLMASALQRGTTVQHNEERQLDILLDRNDHVIATFDTGPTTAGFTLAALDRLREQVELLATIDAYALLHFLAAQAREHHVSSGNFMVEVEGGWTGLARLLGVRESDSHERLRDILDLLQRLHGTYCGVEISGFVTYVHDGARGQRGSVLRIVIGDPLRPGFGGWLEERLGKARPSAKEARMVVPFVGLPPLFGRPNDYALQAGAALETSIYLRQRAPEIVERGGVAIPRADLERIADRAGYARRYLGRTVDNLLGAWLTPPASNPRPAFLELVAPGLYNFGPAHEEAREALAEAGRRTIKGTLQGEATARGKVGGPRRRRRK